MTRSDRERLADIDAAIQRCVIYREHLDSNELGQMAYDAVLRNLAVIGEAVRSLPSGFKEARTDVLWYGAPRHGVAVPPRRHRSSPRATDPNTSKRATPYRVHTSRSRCASTPLRTMRSSLPSAGRSPTAAARVPQLDQIWIAGASCRLVGAPPPEGAVGDVGSCSGNSVAVGWGSGVGGSVVGSSPAHIAYAGWVGSGHPWRTPGGGSIGEMSAEGWGRYP